MSVSRRCLICANLNPCRAHSTDDQIAELARNDAEIAAMRKRARQPAPPASGDVGEAISEQWLYELLYKHDSMCGSEDCQRTAKKMWPDIAAALQPEQRG